MDNYLDIFGQQTFTINSHVSVFPSLMLPHIQKLLTLSPEVLGDSMEAFRG